MPPPPANPAMRLRPWLACLLVAGVVLVCYWPALHGSILWDDPAHLPRPEMRSLVGLGRIWTDLHATQQYYPVLFTAFWVEHHLWGDSTLGYHLTNAVLHALSCCLLAWLLRRLWAGAASGGSPETTAPRRVPEGAEWLAALLFAAHPICVESVAWITEQKNTLSLVFYLLAAGVYLKFDDTRRGRTYLAATALFLLALGSKTSTVTLPAALLVVLWWKRGRIGWTRDVLPLVPWFLAATGFGLVTSWLERTFIGAERIAYDLSLVQRTLLAGRVLWFYLGQLLWPADLCYFYPRWDAAASAPAWTLSLLAAAATTLGLWVLRKKNRGPLAVWLLFCGGLFPVLGFFKVFFFVFSYVNDHFVYLPSVAFFAGAAAAAFWILGRAPRALQMAGGTACLLAIVGLAALSHRQSGLYRNNETLFRTTLEKNPEAWMAHLILGYEFGRDPARHAEAVAECRKAVEMKPDYADTHFGLAVELAKEPGGADEAIEHYEKALQIWPDKLEAHVNLGIDLAKRPARLAEAILHDEAALKLRPGDPGIHNNLANALARMPGRGPEALAHYEEALRRRPDFAEARNNLGVELAKMPARAADAEAQFAAALRIKPDFPEAHANLGFLLAKVPGRRAEAISHLEEAIRLKPSHSEARLALANLLTGQRERWSDAVREYEAVLALQPDLAPAHYDLANLLAHMPGRLADAVVHYEAALAAKPKFAEAHGNLANALALDPNRIEEAVAHDRKALELQPELNWVRRNLLLHLSQVPGRDEEAFSVGEELLRREPGNLDAYNTLAVIHARRGELEAAKALWERALTLSPSYEPARKNLWRLGQMTRGE
ncbi:hypothetical protein DB347_04680 [Opitutaceae bacterium EW11]|nr:hypothetical protein DB347_04680 [Opitutaceae bacterium EW11]